MYHEAKQLEEAVVLVLVPICVRASAGYEFEIPEGLPYPNEV